MRITVLLTSVSRMLRRPLGRVGRALWVAALVTAPTILYFEADHLPLRAHVGREPKSGYILFSDDVAYVAGSRTWDRAWANVLQPHNTHIIPAWRLVTWALAACAGTLERVPEVLAIASYSILVAVMLQTARLVARETGRPTLGLAALVMVGTTSLMLAPATWYSAGQPLWAGSGVLATLWYAQRYRRTGRALSLGLAALAAPSAGWLWSAGHLAGPVTAVYLWADGRRRCRIAALVPLAASLLAVALALALAGRRIDSTVGFHGRTVGEAARPLRGMMYTAQAIPENLVFANLGMAVRTTAAQGAILTLALLFVWLRALNRRRQRPEMPGAASSYLLEHLRSLVQCITPLEFAGLALLVGSYLLEWTVRGYMDYEHFRTINMHYIVPWYDVLPHIGLVLFVVGWWSAAHRPAAGTGGVPTLNVLTWGGALLAGLLSLALITLNRPRVDSLVRASVPPLSPSEQGLFLITRLQTMRANTVLANQAEWQRSCLRRLDRAEAVARQMGLGRDTIRSVFGRRWIPAVGPSARLQPDLYDAAALLDLPEHGRAAGASAVQSALAEYFEDEPEPRIDWNIIRAAPRPPGNSAASP